MALFEVLSIPRLRIHAVALIVPSLIGAASLDALKLPPVAVRLVTPRTGGGCWKDLTSQTLQQRIAQALESTAMLRADSASSSLLRLRVDTADGICDLSFDFQDGNGSKTARSSLLPGQNIADSDALERLLAQLSQGLAKDRSGELDVSTTPQGAAVTLGGVDAGVTPLHLEGIAPGAIPVELALPGWVAVKETLLVQAGQKATTSRTLERPQSWIDSVRNAELVFRCDSIWNEARTRSAKDLAELFDRLAAPVVQGARVTVAILPFDVQGPKDDGYDPGVMAAEYGLARWSGDARFQVVERAAMGKLLSEQAFAQSGAVSDSAAAGMGRLAAARYLVTGTVQVDGGKQVFTARMVSVETGEIVSAAVCEKASTDIEAAYREALGEKGQMSATVYRSLVGPGWGQFYTNHPVQGSIALGAALGSIGFAAWAYMDYADKDDLVQKYRKHDPSTVREDESLEQWVARAEAAREAKNDAGTMLGVSLAVVGAVWVANVVDAAFLGYFEAQRIRGKYYAYVPVPMARPDGIALAWRF